MKHQPTANFTFVDLARLQIVWFAERVGWLNFLDDKEYQIVKSYISETYRTELLLTPPGSISLTFLLGFIILFSGILLEIEKRAPTDFRVISQQSAATLKTQIESLELKNAQLQSQINVLKKASVNSARVEEIVPKQPLRPSAVQNALPQRGHDSKSEEAAREALRELEATRRELGALINRDQEARRSDMARMVEDRRRQQTAETERDTLQSQIRRLEAILIEKERELVSLKAVQHQIATQNSTPHPSLIKEQLGTSLIASKESTLQWDLRDDLFHDGLLTSVGQQQVKEILETLSKAHSAGRITLEGSPQRRREMASVMSLASRLGFGGFVLANPKLADATIRLKVAQ